MKGISAARLESLVHSLIAAGQLVPFVAPSARNVKVKEKIKVPLPVNRHVVSSAGSPGARDRLVSTIAGRGVGFDLHELCFTREMTNGHAANAPEAVWSQYEKRGHRLKSGDQVITGREACVAEMTRRFEYYKESTLPLLAQLGIVEAA